MNFEESLKWVVIRFQICIFDILNTASASLNKQQFMVVIRFQICIFDILNTAHLYNNIFADTL